MFENSSIAVMYAITPCHAGSGSALGVVDLPIQRERHSNWPMIQASGVKGAFRANFERYKDRLEGELQLDSKNYKDKKAQLEDLGNQIFGSDKDKGYAGSTSFSDAKILAYPMRSNVSPFVWITCPSILKRLVKDLQFTEKLTSEVSIPDVKESDAVCLAGNITGSVLLEDFEVKVSKSENLAFLSDYLENAERLLLVADDVFNYGVTDCTQIMAQIRIDADKGTTHEGSLRYQEELPADTIMYSVINWGDSHGVSKYKDDTIKNYITEKVLKTHIQIAGDETCGRGIFKLEWK